MSVSRSFIADHTAGLYRKLLSYFIVPELSVSVTIVTRNRARELAAALHSVQNQLHQPLEVIVIDNDSDDDTVAMLAKDFAGVQLIRLQKNIGCQPARNIAMKKCSGDVIFNLDDDGTLHREAIQNTVACFKKHPEVGLIAASVKVPHEKAASYPHNNEDETMHYTSFFIGAAHAIRKKVLHDAGYFPEYFRGHSESDLALRIINSGWEMMYNPEVVMYHHISDIERNRNTETYYQTRHQLETSARLQPALTAVGQIGWRIMYGFYVALKKGVVPGYAKGVLLFMATLPQTLRRRKPVSKAASRKHHYLKHHHIQNLDMMPDFTTYGFRKMIQSRFKRAGGS